jgi:hypothetical protein
MFYQGRQENCWVPGQKETPPILQIMILKLSPPWCVISKESVYNKNELMNCDLENAFYLFICHGPRDAAPADPPPPPPPPPPLSGPVSFR